MTDSPVVRRVGDVELEVCEHAAVVLRVLAHPVRLRVCLIPECGARRAGANARRHRAPSR